MPTQNYDGTWTGDDGQPYDMTSATNDARYNARVWGDRTMDGPAPKPGSFDPGGLPPDVVANLLTKPGVRAGIAYFIAKGERPNLNQVAALDQQIIPGYKNMGNEEVVDHSGRNLALALTAVGGAGVASALTGFGAAADAGAGAASAADAAPAIADLGAVAPGEFAGAASAVAPTLDTGASLATLSGAGPLASGETGMAPTAAALTPPADLAAPAASTSILGPGGKLANLTSGLNNVSNALSPGGTSTQGASYAALANQLANNRATAAKIDQGGPAADRVALQNGVRASLIAGMDPNAAPTMLNGHALPTLANANTVSYAAALRDALAKRLANGQTATTFGIADPTAQETNANAQAADAAGVGTGINSTLAKVGSDVQTGARIAGLANNGVGLIKTIGSWF